MRNGERAALLDRGPGVLPLTSLGHGSVVDRHVGADALDLGIRLELAVLVVLARVEELVAHLQNRVEDLHVPALRLDAAVVRAL